MSDKYYTYALLYPESMGGTIFYIGKGKGRRIDAHEFEIKGGYSYNTYKERVIRKIWANGEQVVKRKLAEFDTHDEAVLHEIALIFFLPNLTNLTNGGEGTPGRKISEETRQKMSVAQKGHPTKPVSDETRRKLSEANKGRKMSESNRRKLAEANRGRVVSEETRRKISEAKTGKKCKPHPKEACKRRGESIRAAAARRKIENPDYQYPAHSTESRKKLSELGKLRAQTPEGKLALDKAREASIISRKKLPPRPVSDEERRLMSERAKARAQTPEGKQALDRARALSAISRKKATKKPIQTESQRVKQLTLPMPEWQTRTDGKTLPQR